VLSYVLMGGRRVLARLRDRLLRLVGKDETAIDTAIMDGYRRLPQEPDPWADAAAREAIAAEPW
jgi:hypothetical protein